MKKEKGVVIDDNQSRNTQQHEDDFPTPAIKFSTRNASSKYDFVKVKVWLGDNADHYYVLSRFLLSRMLTVTKIPNHVAIKIALELKKLLIDNSLLDVSQSDLEANLFKLMERRGYGEEYINRYKMMTRFHHQRVPLVILVCGTACVGKSTIATQLAQRLNLPNVLQTDMVYELLRTATECSIECRIVRKGLAGDLKKAMKDGKPIIIEGSHLDPSIYLMDDENKLPTDMPAKAEEPNSVTSDDKNVTQMESNSSILCDSHSENTNCSPQDARSMEETNADLLNKVSDCLESINIAESVSDDKVAKEAVGNLGLMVRQLSLDQFENESRRMVPLHNDQSYPAKKITRQKSPQGLHKKIISTLLRPRNWKAPANRRFFLDSYEVGELCYAAEQIFMQETTVLQLKAPIKVFGDLHGQFGDLMRLFDEYGFPSTAGDITYIDYLFLGDYVDRGQHSLETITLLLALKIEYPENVFLIRGNHEAADINALFGFQNDSVEGLRPNARGPGLVTFGPDRVTDLAEEQRVALLNLAVPSPIFSETNTISASSREEWPFERRGKICEARSSGRAKIWAIKGLEKGATNLFQTHNHNPKANPKGIQGETRDKQQYESIKSEPGTSQESGETIKGPETDTNPPVRKEKSGPEPIIVPIVLKMAEFDHKALLEEWISTRTFSDKCLIQDKDKLISNLKTIQDYLCSFKSQGLTVVNISATTFPQTLDWLHSHLLQCVSSKVYCLFLTEALSSQLGIRLYAIRKICLFGPMRKNKVAADGVKARNQTSEVLDKDRLEAAEIVSLAYLTGKIWDRRRNGEAPMKWFGKLLYLRFVSFSKSLPL
ncbi:unnamed protein product [Camellia sinensis]